MNTPIRNEFLADAVVEHLRRGALPSEADADLLNRLPIVDWLRERVQRSDVEWLIHVIAAQEGEFSGLCLSLLQKFDTEPAIQSVLQQRWSGASAFLKAHLMWRILDDPKLPEEWHEELFSFVLREQDVFHAVSLKFLGTPETVVEEAHRRYEGPQFPQSIKWSYLCRVAGVAANPGEGRRFLEVALSSSDQFTRRVATTLPNRFYPSA
jgi:hypothetical protein